MKENNEEFLEVVENKCPYCGSDQIKERVAIRYEDYDKSYPVFRWLGCGRDFSEKDLITPPLPH